MSWAGHGPYDPPLKAATGMVRLNFEKLRTKDLRLCRKTNSELKYNTLIFKLNMCAEISESTIKC